MGVELAPHPPPPIDTYQPRFFPEGTELSVEGGFNVGFPHEGVFGGHLCLGMMAPHHDMAEAMLCSLAVAVANLFEFLI